MFSPVALLVLIGIFISFSAGVQAKAIAVGSPDGAPAVEARQQLLEGEHLSELHTTMASQAALLSFEKAVRLYHIEGDRRREAEASDGAGLVYDYLHQPAKALHQLQWALALRNNVGDQAAVALTLRHISQVYAKANDLPRALAYDEKALSLLHNLGDSAEEVAILLHTGEMYDRAGQPQKALDCYSRVLAIQQQKGEKANQASTMAHLGAVHYATGQWEQAEQELTKAINLLKEAGDPNAALMMLVTASRVKLSINLRKNEKINPAEKKATDLVNIGEVYLKTGQPEKALEFYHQALRYYRASGGKLGQVTALNGIASVFTALGQPDLAAPIYEQELNLVHEVGSKKEEASLLGEIASYYSDRGKPTRSAEYFLRAVSLDEATGDRADQASLLIRLGQVYYETGELAKARRQYERALEIAKQAKLGLQHALAQEAIGLIYVDTGQPQRALEYFEPVLEIWRENGDRNAEAGVLNNIGLVYSENGQPDKALEYYKRALLLSRQVGSSHGEAVTLSNMAVIYGGLGQRQKALDLHRQALSLYRREGDLEQEAIALNNIGNIYQELREPARSRDYLEEALAIHQQIGDRDGEAVTLHNLGSLDAAKHPQKALTFLERALQLERLVNDRQQEANTLSFSAYTLRKLGRAWEARARYEQAIAMADSIVGGITREDLKRSASEAYQFIYSGYIDFLLQRGGEQNTGRALEVSEMARSRALRDLLDGNVQQLPSAAVWRTISTGSGNPTQSENRQTLNRDPSASESSTFTAAIPSRGVVLRPTGASPTGASPTQAPAIPMTSVRGSASEDRAAFLTGGAQALQRRLEGQLPMAAMGHAKPFHLVEARLAAVDGPVVSYHELGDALAIFVVEPSGKIHAALSKIGPADLLRLIKSARLNVEAADDPTALRYSLRRLYDVLLAPVEQWLPSPKDRGDHSPELSNGRVAHRLRTTRTLRLTPNTRDLTPALPLSPTLTVVPFGHLFAVPFAALIRPDGQYLVQRYALRTAPSLTVLRFTRYRDAHLRGAPDQVALYGSPTMPQGWGTLPGALQEVKEVASDFKGHVSGVTVHEQSGATESAFRAEAPAATEIHLATHAYINSAQPMLSGVILAASQGKEPAFQRDGYLTVGEVFHLKLNCRLVTLSACETGRGPTSSDGVFGLQTAFLRAGAASLISSLWNVSDEGTLRLMSRFYQYLEADPYHHRAKALRSAQLDLLHTPGFRQPVYWAPFVLTGEAR